ncbi:MAG: hypothetical protein R6U96_10480 [Promethearchaeia archaeon]
MNLKRIGIATLLGGILGVFCILGASGRLGGWIGNEILIIGLWYNRVVMGLIIGLASSLKLVKDGKMNKWLNSIIRGAILGTFISLQFYLTTSFLDFMSFLAGILYGVIIDLISTLATEKS